MQYLNTSHVKVQSVAGQDLNIINNYLNTSHVKVQFYLNR